MVLHLSDVVLESWRRAQLGQQVEEGGADGVDTAAVKHRQTLLIGQCQLLAGPITESDSSANICLYNYGKPVEVYLQGITCRARTSRIRSTSTSSLASSTLTTANRVKRAW